MKRPDGPAAESVAAARRLITDDYATTASGYYAAAARHGELNDVKRDGLRGGPCRGGGMVSGVPEVWRRVGEPRVPRLITGGQWRSAAACRSADPDLFFPISDSGPAREQTAQAKAICATCRVRRECLAFALRTGQIYGIWGGTTEHERAGVLRQVLASPVGPGLH
jgi:WhiB family redox-sensing transcriptional regulator